MKRSLLLSVCAATVVALFVGQAMAANVTLSLNLRYTDPANTAAGGTWDLMAKTDSPNGISAIVAVLDGISSPVLNTGIGALPIQTKTSGTITEFVYGQDPSLSPGGTFAVGTGAGSAGNVAKDDLYPNAANSYDNFAKIASGSFGATRPSFATFPGAGQGGVTEAAVWNDAGRTVAAPGPETIILGGGDGVRGDSTSEPNPIRGGDANRDGIVNVTDLGILATNWQLSSKGWNDGNFSGTQNDTIVNVTDLGILATNWQLTATAPTIAAVPEPSTVLLGLLGSIALVGRRRR